MQMSTVQICEKHGECKQYRNGCCKCRNEYVTKNRNSRKNKLVAVAGGCCQLCGYNKSMVALEFHHLDRSDKKFSISKMNGTKGYITLLEEIKKCVLLCSNCHKEVEAGISEVPKSDRGEYFAKIELEMRKHTEKFSEKKRICPVCESEFKLQWGKKFCSKKCGQESQRKVVRPNLEQLLLDLSEMSFLAVGKKYGVSDNCIRKWIKMVGMG